MKKWPPIATKKYYRETKIFSIASKFGSDIMLCFAKTPTQAMEFLYQNSRLEMKEYLKTNIANDIINVIEDRKPIDTFIDAYNLIILPISEGDGSIVTVSFWDGVPQVVTNGTIKPDEYFKEITEDLKIKVAARKVKRISPTKLKERAGEIIFAPGNKRYEAQKEFIMKCTDRMMAFSQRELLDAAVKIGIDIDPRATKEEICRALNEYAGYADPRDVPLPEAMELYKRRYQSN